MLNVLDWCLTKMGWTHWDKSPAYALLILLIALIVIVAIGTFAGN